MPVSRKRKKVKNRIKDNKVRSYYNFNPFNPFNLLEPTNKGLELADDITKYLNSKEDIDSLTDNKFIPILKSDMFKDVDITDRLTVLKSTPFIILTSLLNMEFKSGELNEETI